MRDDALIDEIAREVDPDLFQAHGSETPERIATIAARTGKPVIKAIKIKDPVRCRRSAGPITAGGALILYDAKAPETLTDALPGGNGIAFDWSLLGSGKAAPVLHPFGRAQSRAMSPSAITRHWRGHCRCFFRRRKIALGSRT